MEQNSLSLTFLAIARKVRLVGREEYMSDE